MTRLRYILCFFSSAYFLWAADNREKVKAHLGNLTVTEVAKELGKRWAEVDTETKEMYHKMAQEEKAKHTLAMQNYTPSNEFLQKMSAAMLKSRKAPKYVSNNVNFGHHFLYAKFCRQSNFNT